MKPEEQYLRLLFLDCILDRREILLHREFWNAYLAIREYRIFYNVVHHTYLHKTVVGKINAVIKRPSLRFVRKLSRKYYFPTGDMSFLRLNELEPLCNRTILFVSLTAQEIELDFRKTLGLLKLIYECEALVDKANVENLLIEEAAIAILLDGSIQKNLADVEMLCFHHTADADPKTSADRVRWIKDTVWRYGNRNPYAALREKMLPHVVTSKAFNPWIVAATALTAAVFGSAAIIFLTLPIAAALVTATPWILPILLPNAFIFIACISTTLLGAATLHAALGFQRDSQVVLFSSRNLLASSLFGAVCTSIGLTLLSFSLPGMAVVAIGLVMVGFSALLYLEEFCACAPGKRAFQTMSDPGEYAAGSDVPAPAL